MIALTGTSMSVCCIAGGILVFDDPLPATTVGIALQGVAFLLVIVASALTPAPRSALGRLRRARHGLTPALRHPPRAAKRARSGWCAAAGPRADTLHARVVQIDQVV